MSVEVVVLGPPDWERSRATRLAALADAPDAFWSTLADEAEFDEARWRERLTSATSTTFVAVLDGQDVGTAVASTHLADERVAALFAMWVAPSARGRGVGDALVAAVKNWARDRGFEAVRLEVTDTNAAAIRLYERHGAVATGERGTFPPPRQHLHEHEMELPL